MMHPPPPSGVLTVEVHDGEKFVRFKGCRECGEAHLVAIQKSEIPMHTAATPKLTYNYWAQPPCTANYTYILSEMSPAKWAYARASTPIHPRRSDEPHL